MRLSRISLAVVPLFAAVALAAAPAPAAQAPAAVKLGSTGLGRVLVDAHGRTLYVWAHDKGSKSTCSGQCASFWPPLTTKGKPIAARGVRGALLGTSRRSDGRKQVTYNGHPLYT